MRVITGRFGGTSLAGPKGSWMRPTSDRVKELMFSYLSARIQDCSSVLDLFAGTGSLGIEAASRGANHIVFVEQSKQAIKILEKNLKKVKIVADVIRLDVLKFLHRASEMNSSFDLVFCDPPYNVSAYEILIQKLDDSNLIRPGGWLVYEHGRRQVITSGKCLVVEDVRMLGDTVVTFMRSERIN